MNIKLNFIFCLLVLSLTSGCSKPAESRGNASQQVLVSGEKTQGAIYIHSLDALTESLITAEKILRNPTREILLHKPEREILVWKWRELRKTNFYSKRSYPDDVRVVVLIDKDVVAFGRSGEFGNFNGVDVSYSSSVVEWFRAYVRPMCQ